MNLNLGISILATALIVIARPNAFEREGAPTNPAQPQSATDSKSPAFEVASIRPSNPDVRAVAGISVSPGRFTATRMSVNGLISYAYSVTIYDVLGGPDWTDSQEFNIEAKAEDPGLAYSAPTKPAEDECRLMVQSLLAERFKLHVSHGTRVESVYALVKGKTIPGLVPASPPDPAPDGSPASQWSINFVHGQWIAKRQTMGSLADLLTGQPGIGRIVLDETGLKGAYDFTLDWSPIQDSGGPTVFAALAKLGLKLELKKHFSETIVIDHVEKPTEN